MECNHVQVGIPTSRWQDEYVSVGYCELPGHYRLFNQMHPLTDECVSWKPLYTDKPVEPPHEHDLVILQDNGNDLVTCTGCDHRWMRS